MSSKNKELYKLINKLSKIIRENESYSTSKLNFLLYRIHKIGYNQEKDKKKIKKLIDTAKKLQETSESDSSSDSSNYACSLTSSEFITEIQYNSTKLEELKTSGLTEEILKFYMIEYLWKVQDYIRCINELQIIKINDTHYEVELSETLYTIGSTIDSNNLIGTIDNIIANNILLENYYI